MRLSRPWLIGLGAGAAVLGAVGWALGPGAPMVVTWLADGAKVGRFGRLDLEGVRGPHIGALRAARVAIIDERGAWLEAQGVTLDWAPGALLGGDVMLHRVRADAIEVSRRPDLTPPRPPGWFRPDVRIGALTVMRLHLGEPLFGVEAELTVSGALATEDGAVASATLQAQRTDAATDSISLRYRDGERLLDLTVAGAPGGVVAAALGAPDQTVAITASAEGEEARGGGRLAARVGETELATGDAAWTNADWRARGAMTLTAAPVLAPLADRFGAALTLQAEGARGEGDDHPFAAQARADNLSADISGALDDRFRLRGEAQLRAATPRLDRLVPEMRIGAGATTINGAMRLNDGRLRFRGEGDVADLSVIGLNARARGPVSLDWGPTRVETEGAFALTPSGGDALNRRLLDNGRLEARVVIDRVRSRVDIARAAIESDAVRLSASGQFTRGRGAIDGDWHVTRLAAATREIEGAAQGRWRVAREDDGPVRLEARGAARGFSAKQRALAQLLGAAPRLEAIGAFRGGGLTLDRARLDGANLRLGARGLLAETLDLRIEAAARGPIALGAAEVDGAVDATGRLTGPIARPRLALEADAQSFSAAGVAVGAPHLAFTYDARTRRGESHVTGVVAGAPGEARALIASDASALRFEELTFSAAGVEGTGQAAFTAHGPALDLAFTGALSGIIEGAIGRIEGQVELTPIRRAPARLSLLTRLRNAGYGDLRGMNGELALEGPMDALAARATLRGYADEAPITLDGEGAIGARDGRLDGALEWNAAIGGERFATRAPAQFSVEGERVNATAALHAGAGEVDLTYRADARSFAAAARFDRAELSVVSVLFGARVEGVMSGQANLESAGERLRGVAELSVNDARLPARMRDPLNLVINATLEPTRLSGALHARSPDGLDAAIEGSAPVVTTARPLRIAITEDGEGEARWRANGPADALWSLVGGLDQSLSGQMRGQGQIRFNAETLRGEGALTLSGGRFEDKRAGLAFTDVEARMAFTEAGESQFQLSARDDRGGRLTGLGAARGIRSGRMTLTLDRLRFVERSDVTAAASGDLALEWSEAGATLSGALTLDEAQLALATRPDSIIPHIDVVEINRPDGDRAPARPRPAGPAANLDLTLRAPGRVYTRGRGLNAEWALDARLRGTSAAPLLQGEARLIRGEFDLAGRPFEMTRGRIGFTGALDDTTIDLLAERVEPELTARAAITGRLFEPAITFSSDPALPEDEIMPQILFGRSAEDLSPLEAAQLAASLAALAGGAAFDIAGMARAAVGLDRFDVREDGEGVLVSGGRYLTRDVYFEVSRTGIGEPGAKVEWRARPQLSIVTSFRSNEDQRVSIRWRRDY